MTLTSVAVGMDGSPTSTNALRWAVDFAASTGVPLTAVATWEMPYVSLLPDRIEGLPTAEVMAEQCHQRLKRALDELGPDHEVTPRVVEGRPGPTLASTAEAFEDVLVVGRTGRGKRHGLARAAEVILGSTARHCVHHARVPVITVPSGSTWRSPATVVVGLDGSSSSAAALLWALRSLPSDSTIRVVRAFTPWIGDWAATAGPAVDDGDHEAVVAETRQWVDAVFHELGPDDRSTRPVVEVIVGSARDALVDLAESVDLLVVGKRGRTGVAGMVLGSVADHVVRYAACPVVVIPHGQG